MKMQASLNFHKIEKYFFVYARKTRITNSIMRKIRELSFLKETEFLLLFAANHNLDYAEINGFNLSIFCGESEFAANNSYICRINCGEWVSIYMKKQIGLNSLGIIRK